jgi:sarcosine oxidase
MPDRIYDAIVLGLGAMGSAALFQLSQRKASVLGIDQFQPPHELGSSHGDTRITRIACGEGKQYSTFATRSHEVWRELEHKTGRELLTQNGLLVISGKGERSTVHGIPAFLQNTVNAAQAAGVPYEMLSGRDARSRFPVFNLRDDDTVYFDKIGGFVRPEACVQTQLELAQASGADIHFNEAVTGFEQRGELVQIKTARSIYTARRVIVAAGAYLPDLLGRAHRDAFTVRRQVLYWFRANDASFDSFRPENLPVYIWKPPATEGVYGFPATRGPEDGIKIATGQFSEATTPQTVDRTVSAREAAVMYETYVAPYFPTVMPTPIRTKVCLYTCLPGSRFIIDLHPEHDRIIIASPCSGHGFKHSAGIGDALAQMALGESAVRLNGATVDMTPFAFRPTERT